jgi:conjugative relaxase-like TrwC/TraI family protein
MLSIGVLHWSAQAGTYYAQDDYYTKGGAGEPSQWDGSGAASSGLAAAVDRAQFEALLNGELPNGIVLKRGQEGKHQPGWDLTFSAPKSVSLLALVGDDRQVLQAHDEAVTASLHASPKGSHRPRRGLCGLEGTSQRAGNRIPASDQEAAPAP